MLDLMLYSLPYKCFLSHDISTMVFNGSILLGVVHFREEPYMSTSNSYNFVCVCVWGGGGGFSLLLDLSW